MLHRRIAVGLVLASLSVSGRPASDPRAPAIDAVFADYDSSRSPGCAVGVIREGRFVFKRGYGMADLERGVALSPTSILRIGSTSKQFTAAVMVLLEQDGKLKLDDDIRLYLPEIPTYERTITIRHLLNHTSGMRDYLTLFDLAGYRDDDWFDNREVVEMIARQRELNFAPGDEYLYSNSGFFLLSQIAARVAGESMRRYAARRIFEPLAMFNTHFHDDHTEVVANRAMGYSPRADGFRLNMTTLDMVGDGGIFTSVEELLAWDRNFYEPRVGGHGFLEALHEKGRLADGAEIDYALGLTHGVYRGLPTVSHGGSFVGFRAEMLRFPEQQTTVICLCNLSTTNPTRLARRVADVVLADQLGPAEEGPRRSGGDGDPATRPPTGEERGAYAGDYYSDELDQTYRLIDSGEALLLRVARLPAAEVSVIEPDRLTVRRLQLRFTREGGRPSGFLLDAGRVRNLRFRRLE